MKETFEELVKINKRLREECPWDRVQDFESLKSPLVDEAKEVVEAVEKEDYKNLEEELGDLLHNILFISNIAEEKGLFTMKDVLESIKAKLIRRHPHVFGDEKALTPEDSLRLWKKVKEAEKNE
ncbi:MAG: nucleotide pyrophosphohydrolase [Nanoarchaeota archaeon]|nr:nucleotide pyrophosphohydrolase [Nanoarchaeota archaeon]